MRGLGVTVLLLVCMQVHAGFSNTGQASASRFEQRKLYQQAIDAIKHHQRSRAQNIARQLTDYPLYPYILYTDKIYNINRQNAQNIHAFAEQYQDLPIASQLLENWVYILAKRGKWQSFIDQYDPKTFNGERNACYYAYALYKVGKKDAAWAEAKKLWLVGHSQPDECDHVFRAWRETGKLTPDLAWQRYILSLDANKYSLARYLTRFLSEKDNYLAKLFARVRRDPRYIENSHHFDQTGEKIDSIILYGINLLAWRDPQAALTSLNHYRQTRPFTAQEVNEAYTRIGVKLALNGDNNNLLDSLPVDLRHDTKLLKARIRLALHQLSWSHALVLINLLPDDEKSASRWQYWKARILMGSPDAADKQLAQEIYKRLSKERNFYGFMSADAIGVDYHFEDSPIDVDMDEVLNLEAAPGIQRALELFTLDQRHRARREWYFATRDFDARELQIAARVAQKWGWYRQAIKSMIDARAWDDLDIRFPLAYYDSFVSNARTWDIPLQWSLAIARQESAFMPDARSRAGALGIMQILPSTAKLTANRQGLDFNGADQLRHPVSNIRLGSAYLGDLLRKFDNNRIIASAAYNAGPARVQRWINPSLPLDVWIETIPFTETRDYVENVLMFAAIYARRLSQTHPLIYAHERHDFSNQQVTLADSPMDESSTIETGSQRAAE